MKIRTIIILFIIAVCIMTITIYVVNNHKVVLPLDRLNKLDADIIYELKTENWYAKIVVVYDPVDIKGSKYYTKQYHYLEYIGDDKIFEENKPLEYTFTCYGTVSGKTVFNHRNIDNNSMGLRGVLDLYPDKATLEIDIDGQVETYELLRQELIK